MSSCQGLFFGKTGQPPVPVPNGYWVAASAAPPAPRTPSVPMTATTRRTRTP